MQFERGSRYVDDAVVAGHRLVTGGGRPADRPDGFFFAPTLFADVDNAAVIAQKEVFGPVGCVISYNRLDDAIALANASPFGLTGTIFTHDAEEAYRVARAIRTGSFSQNGLKFDFSIAFGVFKQSGVGRAGGVEGLRTYIKMKTVFLDAAPVAEAA